MVRGIFFVCVCVTLSELQMTLCQPAVTWTWRTGSPTWSRSCSFRRMKSSCWNRLWLTPSVDWAPARSRPRGCIQEVLGGGLWPLRLQPNLPKVSEWRDARGEALHAADEPAVFLNRFHGHRILNNLWAAAQCYWSVNDHLTFSASAPASSSLQTCE